MTDPSSQPPRRRLVHHERLRRWSPLTRAEGREARRFVERLVEFPYVTASVVALLVWFYLVQLAFGWPLILLLPVNVALESELVMEALGGRLGWLDGSAVRAGEWWRLISSTFLHGSVLHLVGNAFVLFFLGRIVENIHGRSAWIAAYVGGGIGGALLSVWLNGVNSLGASGAILGLLGVIAVFGLRYGDRIPKAFRDSFRQDIWFFVLLVGLLSLLPAVDWAGHLGGFLVGVVVGLLWPAALLEESPDHTASVLARGLSGGMVVLFVASLAIVGFRIWETSRMMPARDIRAAATATEEGDLDRALALTRHLESQLPESEPLHLLRVIVLLRAERNEEAFALLEDVAGDSLRMQPYLMSAAFEVDRPDMAVQALRRMEEVDRRFFAAYDGDNALAWALFLAEPTSGASVDEGLVRVRRALKRDRSNRAWRNTLAYGLVLDGAPKQALTVVDELIAGRSRDEQSQDIFIKVMALADLGRLAEATRLYTDFAADFPDGTLREEAAERLRSHGASIP